VEPNARQFDHLKQVNDLVYNPWEGAILFCLQAGPLRWSEIARHITVWSGERPSDSQITRALKPLQRHGYVSKTGGPGHRQGDYSITDAGCERAARIAALITTFEKIEEQSDG
jgi:DNA-binding PadR family transcriptional regulator